jgi:hypothetical protein
MASRMFRRELETRVQSPSEDQSSNRRFPKTETVACRTALTTLKGAEDDWLPSIPVRSTPCSATSLIDCEWFGIWGKNCL